MKITSLEKYFISLLKRENKVKNLNEIIEISLIEKREFKR